MLKKKVKYYRSLNIRAKAKKFKSLRRAQRRIGFSEEGFVNELKFFAENWHYYSNDLRKILIRDLYFEMEKKQENLEGYDGCNSEEPDERNIFDDIVSSLGVIEQFNFDQVKDKIPEDDKMWLKFFTNEKEINNTYSELIEKSSQLSQLGARYTLDLSIGYHNEFRCDVFVEISKWFKESFPKESFSELIIKNVYRMFLENNQITVGGKLIDQYEEFILTKTHFSYFDMYPNLLIELQRLEKATLTYKYLLSYKGENKKKSRELIKLELTGEDGDNFAKTINLLSFIFRRDRAVFIKILLMNYFKALSVIGKKYELLENWKETLSESLMAQ